MENKDTYIRFYINEVCYEYTLKFIFNTVLFSGEAWLESYNCKINVNKYDDGTRVLNIFSPCIFNLQLTVFGSENCLIYLKWTANKKDNVKFEVELPSGVRYNTSIFDNLYFYCSLCNCMDNKVVREYDLFVEEETTCGLKIPKELMNKHGCENLQLRCIYTFMEIKDALHKGVGKPVYSVEIELVC